MSSPELRPIHLTRPAKLRLTFLNKGSKIVPEVASRGLVNQTVHATVISENPQGDTVLEIDLPPPGTVISFYKEDFSTNVHDYREGHPPNEPPSEHLVTNRPGHPPYEPPLVSIEVL